MSLKKHVETLYEQIMQGQILPAFETYYHEDVVMQENLEAPRVGKTENRAYEEKFVNSVEAVHGGGVDHIVVDEALQVAMIESWMDVTFKDGNRVKIAQVAVQKWQGDQIVHERFYHG